MIHALLFCGKNIKNVLTTKMMRYFEIKES